MNNTNSSKKGMVWTIVIAIIVIVAGIVYLKTHVGATITKADITSTTSTVPASNWKTYANHGFTMTIPANTVIQDSGDKDYGYVVSFVVASTSVDIRVQADEYLNGKIVPATCNDATTSNPSQSVVINGVSYVKTNVSGSFGGMQSAAVAYSYCHVQNLDRYEIIPSIGYSRYPCQNEKDGSPIPNCVKPRIPTDDEASNIFDNVMGSLNLKITN